MFLDGHQNLLSTFGRDSLESNRVETETAIHHQGSRCINDQFFQSNKARNYKSRYEKLLKERNIKRNEPYRQHDESTSIIKRSQTSSHLVRKMKTQSDVDHLNDRISVAITGIAESVCRSKINSTKKQIPTKTMTNHKLSSFSVSNIKKSHMTIDSMRDRCNQFDSKQKQTKVKKIPIQRKRVSSLYPEYDKQNLFFQSNEKKHPSKSYANFYPIKKNVDIGSTQRKNTDKQPPCHHHIKSSFSIDINSEQQSLQSSKKSTMIADSRCSFNQQVVSNKIDFLQKKIMTHEKQMERRSNTKENNKNALNNQTIKKPFISHKQEQIQIFKNHNRLAYIQESPRQQISKNFDFQLKKDDIEIRKSFGREKIKIQDCVKNKKIYPVSQAKDHPLIKALQKQISLDYDLRHAKHLFSGIEEPYYDCSEDDNQLDKWNILSQQLKKIGLNLTINQIKSLFLPSEGQLDPFLSVGPSHSQLVYSLIYAYETAQIHWQQNICQKWEHWDLRDIELTIQKIDRDRKGFISLEDLSSFIGNHTDNEYRNRDVFLIYNRFLNGSFCTDRSKYYSPCQGGKLKFRVIVDNLIRPFTKKRN